MKGNEQGITFWEICLSLALLLAWVGVVAPFVEAATERVERLETNVRTYERLQGEVLRDAANPSGRQAICDGDLCLPTL
ncbi:MULTISPECIES: hypothetical protein [Exiguobacterium]|uniref:hypothetical protein n=1 Tax=Exiguobacterium TaxID=33986 RepID=UPI001BEA6A56|nr:MULTISPECIES: hypothetical protein [Exiguobacterium]MCT4777290.1 hypothetical protein [Exiguobacterium aquaticum]MCT4789546.1 hypothetical protein [Exiguobacterium mexicanum]